MKPAYTVVYGPIISEKGTMLTQDQNKVVFEVDPQCNKNEIRKAIESLYPVKVVRVNTINIDGKNKRVRLQMGKTASWKKAIVTLKEGDKIEFT